MGSENLGKEGFRYMGFAMMNGRYKDEFISGNNSGKQMIDLLQLHIFKKFADDRLPSRQAAKVLQTAVNFNTVKPLQCRMKKYINS